MKKNKNINCPICNSKAVTPHCTKHNSQYLKCNHCQHCFLATKKSSSEYSTFYESRTSHHASQTKINWDYSNNKYRYVYLPLLSTLSRFIKSGRLVDVGCSNGAFVKGATKYGWHATGVELEKASAELATSNDINVINTDLIDANFSSNSIDCITMWQLIEHIEDFEPLLNEIYRILKPGGILAVSTPNIQSIAWKILGQKWRAVDPKVHLHLFSVDSLARLFQSYDYEVSWFSTRDIKPSTVKDLINRNNSKNNSTGTTSSSVAEFTADLDNTRLAFMFYSLRILNYPLDWFKLGEDIYMILKKPI